MHNFKYKQRKGKDGTGGKWEYVMHISDVNDGDDDDPTIRTHLVYDLPSLPLILSLPITPTIPAVSQSMHFQSQTHLCSDSVSKMPALLCQASGP